MFVATDICCYIRWPNVNYFIFPIIDAWFWQRLSGQYKEEERLLNLLYTNERHESRLSKVQYRLLSRIFEMNHA